jgi:hypothetical protein
VWYAAAANRDVFFFSIENVFVCVVSEGVRGVFG